MHLSSLCYKYFFMPNLIRLMHIHCLLIVVWCYCSKFYFLLSNLWGLILWGIPTKRNRFIPKEAKANYRCDFYMFACWDYFEAIRYFLCNEEIPILIQNKSEEKKFYIKGCWFRIFSWERGKAHSCFYPTSAPNHFGTVFRKFHAQIFKRADTRLLLARCTFPLPRFLAKKDL